MVYIRGYVAGCGLYTGLHRHCISVKQIKNDTGISIKEKKGKAVQNKLFLHKAAAQKFPSRKIVQEKYLLHKAAAQKFPSRKIVQEKFLLHKLLQIWKRLRQKNFLAATPGKSREFVISYSAIRSLFTVFNRPRFGNQTAT